MKKPRYWFLTNRFAKGTCASCTALATGWDSRGALRCCGECGPGGRAGVCNCAFRQAQRRLAREMPVEQESRRAMA